MVDAESHLRKHGVPKKYFKLVFDKLVSQGYDPSDVPETVLSGVLLSVASLDEVSDRARASLERAAMALSQGLEAFLREEEELPRIHTGTGLDKMLSPDETEGVRFGTIIDLYGPYGSGKTVFSAEAAVLSASNNATVYYVDTEKISTVKLFFKIAEALNVPKEKILGKIRYYRVKPGTSPVSFAKIVESVCEEASENQPSAVIIDSLSRPIRTKVFDERSKLTERARILRRIEEALRKASSEGSLVIYTSQIYGVPADSAERLGEQLSPIPRYVQYGGEILKHLGDFVVSTFKLAIPTITRAPCNYFLFILDDGPKPTGTATIVKTCGKPVFEKVSQKEDGKAVAEAVKIVPEKLLIL